MCDLPVRLSGMQAWSSPGLGHHRLDRFGPAPAVRLHDAATGSVIQTEGSDPARLYVCGITPYDATHLGHASTYVAFDVLLRAWHASGRFVEYVQNVTDIDDPLLARAHETGEDWESLAHRETQLFRDDMTALRVVPPDHYIGAVESIPLIVDLIEQLRERGAVYDVDGDLYFAVSADHRFGAVSGLDRPEMIRLFAERGGDPQRPGKRDPLDCLVWTRQRPGEPAWATRLGTGRPGWHIECTAIALHYLGMPLDVQGGGSDLAFPHHEMCASEGQVATGRTPFARIYAHAGMVGLDGEKMSKSKGNLVLVSRLRADDHDPMALRLALLARHYRSQWDWTADELEQAGRRLRTWRAGLEAGGRDATGLVKQVREATAHDLDAPAALAAVDAWAAEALSARSTSTLELDAAGASEDVRAVLDASLGVVI
jgi:L-cysteine:1D-myo-inositol 2-amino-2-deoxy-alpha-D-glucopyranoside ligase